MRNFTTAFSYKRASAIAQAAVLALAAFAPVLLVTNGASAAGQLTTRYIDMSANQTSEGSGRDGGDAFGQDVTYRVSFNVDTSATVEGIVIEFCDSATGPIIGDACTAPTGLKLDITGASTGDTTALAFTEVSTLLNANWAIDTTNSTDNLLVISDATTTGDSLIKGNTITFDLGTSAAADGIVNPTSAGTFYARILTYTNDVTAAAYASATPGTHVDDGGIALSVANHLTVTARVREVLEFCIGTETDSTYATRDSTDDCTKIIGTALDLGVVEASTIQRTSDIDIANDGVAMIRTNAQNGAAVYYKAEQESGLTNGGDGTLRIAGVDDCTTIANVDNVCFNSAGGDVTNPTQSAITANTELFGMTLTNLDTTMGGATANLSCDPNYDGDGLCGSGTATGYAWDPTGVFDTIATSSGPTDDEAVNIEFAATASPTTPTGLYTVTANFVATPTF